ncbi:hypothetical protein V5O48_019131 [Marasmius crinis-equi]|uniref:Uncharacterized protein n=1 Tax=Marasmius crinis-equi TaxID=585013 RepID=A0ABR3EJ86_9AGAR
MDPKPTSRFSSFPRFTPKRPQLHPQPVRVAKFPTSSGVPIDPTTITVACAGYELIQLLAQAAASSVNSAKHHQIVLVAILNFLHGPTPSEPLSHELSEIHATQIVDFCNQDRYAGLKCHSLSVVWELDSTSLHPQEVGMVPVYLARPDLVRDRSLAYGSPILGQHGHSVFRGVLLQPTIQRGQWLYILGESQDPKLPFYVKVPFSKRADYWPELYPSHLLEANRISPLLVGIPSHGLSLEGMMQRAAHCYEGPDVWQKRKRVPRATEETLQKLCGEEMFEKTFIPWPGSPVLAERVQMGDWLDEHRIVLSPSEPGQPPKALSFSLPLHWTSLDTPEPPSDFPDLLSLLPNTSSPKLNRKDRQTVSRSRSEIGFREALQITPPPSIAQHYSSASPGAFPGTEGTDTSSRFSTSTTETESKGKKPTWRFIQRVRALSTPGKKDKGKGSAPSRTIDA